MAERLGLLLAVALLAGCGNNPQVGGGTELPSPIQVMIIRYSNSDTIDSVTIPPDSNVLVAARQWRLWDLQTMDSDSTLLESRGLLTDSSGVITLPPDSGTFLVEAWTKVDPPDSVDVRIRVATADLPLSSNCMTTLVKGSKPVSIRSCNQDKISSPSSLSGVDPSRLPDVVTLVHLPGLPVHRFRMLDVSEDTLPIGESRLWQLDHGKLSFRGIMKQNLSKFPDFPTLFHGETFILETWDREGMANARVAAKVDGAAVAQAANSCVIIRFGNPLPEILTLHECNLQPINLSGGANPPSHWGFMEYRP